MERPANKTRLLGPYGPEDDARTDATRIAEIQTKAWAAWLSERDVSQALIEESLWSDIHNDAQMDAREENLRQAFERNEHGSAILYIGAFSEAGDMVGFAKFLINHDSEGLFIFLEEIDVLPGFQGQEAGDPADHMLAKKMIYSMLAQVRDENAILGLRVLVKNERARALYESLALEVVDESEMFNFVDADDRVIRQEPYLMMKGPAITAKSKLRQKLFGAAGG